MRPIRQLARPLLLSRSIRTFSATPLRPSSGASTASIPPKSTNPALSFPCLDHIEKRTQLLSQPRDDPPRSRSKSQTESGPEPSYTTGEHQTFRYDKPILLDWGGILPSFDIAYETWGTLNKDRSNAILLHAGLSASSHAHSTAENPLPGWWENFIGPGRPLDTDKHFIICTNMIGGCFGSTGPASTDPANGEPYATRFPILTIGDMVKAQFRLLDHFRIRQLYASVGASLGGMQSLAAGVMFPSRVGRVVSISGCARSHPYGIALRHIQRQVLMMDPNWSRGFYYSSIPPHAGMKLARQVATTTYRSGPEWEQRFGRRRADPSRPPALCPDFLIETYLDHAGEKWCLEYDPNSLLYVSKAMDLFDLGIKNQRAMGKQREGNSHRLDRFVAQMKAGGGSHSPSGQLGDNVGELESAEPPVCSLTLPATPYEETTSTDDPEDTDARDAAHLQDLVTGLSPLRNTPVFVLGVKSDILFPAWQQREIAQALQAGGNTEVSYVELSEEQSLFGHDTFLLDQQNVGGNVGRFLASKYSADGLTPLGKKAAVSV